MPRSQGTFVLLIRYYIVSFVSHCPNNPLFLYIIALYALLAEGHLHFISCYHSKTTIIAHCGDIFTFDKLTSLNPNCIIREDNTHYQEPIILHPTHPPTHPPDRLWQKHRHTLSETWLHTSARCIPLYFALDAESWRGILNTECIDLNVIGFCYLRPLLIKELEGNHRLLCYISLLFGLWHIYGDHHEKSKWQW